MAVANPLALTPVLSWDAFTPDEPPDRLASYAPPPAPQPQDGQRKGPSDPAGLRFSASSLRSLEEHGNLAPSHIRDAKLLVRLDSAFPRGCGITLRDIAAAARDDRWSGYDDKCLAVLLSNPDFASLAAEKAELRRGWEWALRPDVKYAGAWHRRVSRCTTLMLQTDISGEPLSVPEPEVRLAWLFAQEYGVSAMGLSRRGATILMTLPEPTDETWDAIWPLWLEHFKAGTIPPPPADLASHDLVRVRRPA